jgi:uncharacterized membrane protein HdeD (DUF308 family)
MTSTGGEVAEQDFWMAEAKHSWKVALVEGIVWVVLGIVVTLHPSTSLNVICVLIGIMVLIGGVVRLVQSFSAAHDHRALTAIIGVFMITVGVLLIRHLHFSRLLVAVLVGLVFIVQGTLALLVGLSGEAREGRAWPIVMGLLSLAAGIVVIAVPENSLTVLAVLLGIWFIVLGVFTIIGAMLLRHVLNRSAEAD